MDEGRRHLPEYVQIQGGDLEAVYRGRDERDRDLYTLEDRHGGTPVAAWEEDGQVMVEMYGVTWVLDDIDLVRPEELGQDRVSGRNSYPR